MLYEEILMLIVAATLMANIAAPHQKYQPLNYNRHLSFLRLQQPCFSRIRAAIAFKSVRW
jgi:hypothetical protein